MRQCLFSRLTMLVSQTDYDFFSSPSPLSPTSSAVRVTTRPRVPSLPSSPTNNPLNTSPSFSLPLSKKPRLVHDNGDQLASPCHSASKQLPLHKKKVSRKPKSAATRVPSRASSRQNPSPEPIYRSNRSRSTSLFLSLDIETQTSLFKRRWRTEQCGDPGDRFLGSEAIVRRLIKSYKTCV